MKIAVFDFDGTILKGDSLIISAKQTKGFFNYFYILIKLIPLFLKWKFKKLSDKEFKTIFIKSFDICDVLNNKNKNLSCKNLYKALEKKINPIALKRINQHKSNGNRIIICSASPTPLISWFAEKYELELISTELTRNNNIWKPEINSPNCKGLEKVKRLKFLLGDLSKYELEVYGDSEGDKEMLEIADIPHFRNFNDTKRSYIPIKYKQYLLSFILVFGFYGFLSFWTKSRQIIPLITEIWPTIILCLLLIFFGYIIRFIRWVFIGKKLTLNFLDKSSFLIWMGSYTFTTTPAKTGEFVRCLLLKENKKTPLITSLLLLFFERITDFFSILLISLIYLGFTHNFKFEHKIIFLAFALFLIIKYSKILNFLLNFFTKFSINSKYKKLKYFLIKSKNPLRKLFDKKTFLISTLIGTCSWFLEGVAFFILLKAININNINLIRSTFIHTFSGLLGALSFLPGGIGATELSTIGILSSQGISLDNAIPATLLIRLMTLWFASALGLISLIYFLKD